MPADIPATISVGTNAFLWTDRPCESFSMSKGSFPISTPANVLRFFCDMNAKNPIAAATEVAIMATVTIRKIGDDGTPSIESIGVSLGVLWAEFVGKSVGEGVKD